jgi:hypothetical protein
LIWLIGGYLLFLQFIKIFKREGRGWGSGEEGLLRQEQFNSLTGRLNTKSAIYQYIFRREEKGAGKRERGSVWVWGRNSLTN